MKEFKNGQEVEVLLGDDWVKRTYIGKSPDPMRCHVTFGLSGASSYSDDAIRAIPIKQRGWINIYKNGSVSAQVYASSADAMDASACSKNRVATIKIEWEEQP